MTDETAGPASEVVDGRGAGRGFYFVANALWLDFVNTEAALRGSPVDLLRDPGDLIAWFRRAGILNEAAARDAESRWGGAPAGARLYDEARRLRSALRALAARAASGEPIGDDVVGVVNQVLATRPGYPQVVREGTAFATRFHPLSAEATHLLVPVAESAAELLVRGDPALVRKCENPACVLYFYDTTKNRSRRWCSMDACGSRQKAAAYYRRTRGRPRE
jgi:predicted RNA-binding Zn ribbon-like protein